jgi:hypothetical protein
VDAVIAAYQREGLQVETELRSASLDLAADHDPGFDRRRFSEALAAIDRLPDSLFQPYGMVAQDTLALRQRMRAWARRISAHPRGDRILRQR